MTNQIASRGGVFDGVIEQVDEHLVQAVPVAQNAGHARRRLQCELHPPCFGGLDESRDGLFGDGAEIHWQPLERHQVQARQPQQVFDQPRQPFGLAGDEIPRATPERFVSLGLATAQDLAWPRIAVNGVRSSWASALIK
jgi:hypothetical protein